MLSTISALQRRATALQTRTQSDCRFTDQAIRLIEVDRVDGHVVETGNVSPIYGGVWDSWIERYTGDVPAKCIDLKVSRKQFAILTRAARCDVHHVLLIGARRSSKSETMAIWLLIRGLLIPGKPISMLFPKHAKAVEFVEEKVMPRGRALVAVYHRSPGRYDLRMINGTVIRFLSGKVVDDARGSGVASGGCDEKQITPTEAWDNVLLSLSEGGRWFQTLETGTALMGDFEEYVEKAKENRDFHVEFMTSFDNPFIDRSFLEDAKRLMDPRRYAQEVLAEFVAQSAVVYYPFERGTHVKAYADSRTVLASRYGLSPGLGDDITDRICNHWFRKQAKYVIGVDFNISPMCSVVYKILRAPPGVADIWWAIDEVVLDDRADATQLALELKRRGYYPACIVPDASGQYSEGGRSSHRMLRDEGFAVFSAKKNPNVRDRVNALNAKLQNKASHVTLFFDPKCVSTVKALISQRINLKTGTPEKDNTHEHRADAAGYPVVYMCPAAIPLRQEGHGYASAR